MRTWIHVAVLVKARNSSGRFVVRSTAGLPFLLEPGDEVALVPPQIDLPRRVTVEEVLPIDEGSAEVAFCDVRDTAVMRGLVGMHCLIRRDSIDEDELQAAPALWEGWRVVDEWLGDVGEAVGVIENPAQLLLEVRNLQGSFLVPVVDEIVLDLDQADQIVHVSLPAGLVDLNA